MLQVYTKADIDEYQAVADPARAREIANTESPFRIVVRFLGGLTNSQKQAFANASDRWAEVIVGDLPDVRVGAEIIDDVVIDAQGIAIDGPGGILGQAGPQFRRPSDGSKHGGLPAKGIMQFDTADLAVMEQEGFLDDVILHEMGHVIGMLELLWAEKGFIIGRNTPQWAFTGPTATEEYGKLLDPCSGQPMGQQQDTAGQRGGPPPVPVEDKHGPGTRGSHWRETVFGNELMTGFVSRNTNPLSRITGGALKDLGYDVDLDACDEYQLPTPTQLAEFGLLGAAVAEYEARFGVMLPTVPISLTAESLNVG